MTAITSIHHDERNYSHHVNQHAQCNNDKRMHCVQHLKEIAQCQSIEHLKEAARLSLFIAIRVLVLGVSIKSGSLQFASLGNPIIDGCEKFSSLYSQSNHNSLQNAYKICDIHLTQCQQDKLSSLFEKLANNQEEYERKRHDILRSAGG